MSVFLDKENYLINLPSGVKTWTLPFPESPTKINPPESIATHSGESNCPLLSPLDPRTRILWPVSPS